MSRAKLPPDELRKRIVSIRCSQAEFDDIEKAADLAQLNISDWVRDTTLATARGTIAMKFPVPAAAVPEPEVPISGVAIAAAARRANWEAELAEIDQAEWRQVQINRTGTPEPATECTIIEDPPIGIDLTEHAEVPLGWADHWAAMEKMEPGEATDRLYELAAGRQFPVGFRTWPKARKIEWLDKEWPL